MDLIKTPIEDLFLIKPRVFEDKRGYFFESYSKQAFETIGLEYTFVQDNESCSSYGTIRGLHFQRGGAAQAKLVRVLQGVVLDVAVDLRPKSKTSGQYFSAELSSENKLQMIIPRGFAHGFSVLSQTAVFAYKCDNVYDKASEGCIAYDDVDLNIDWKIPLENKLLSEKDASAPTFKEYVACI